MTSTDHPEPFMSTSSSTSISQLKDDPEGTEYSTVNENLTLPGSDEQQILPIDRENIKVVHEITNLGDKSEIMDVENNESNQNSKSVIEVEDNLNIPDTGIEDISLAIRDKTNKQELSVEEAEIVISTLHSDPEHQFGWAKWKPSDEKLVIPGTGIYPWNFDEKSPTHSRNTDSQERLHPFNGAYSVTLVNNVILILLVFVNMLQCALIF